MVRVILRKLLVPLLLVSLLAASASSLAWWDWFGGRQAQVTTTTTTVGPFNMPIFREVDRLDQSTTEADDVDEQQTGELGANDNDETRSFASSERLMREFHDVRECDNYTNGLFTAELVDDNIYEWQVKLFIVNPETYKLQLTRGAEDNEHIMLQMSYDDNYPASPPFVRLIYPAMTSIYVHKGGALCMPMLMKRNWKVNYTSESLILYIATTLAGEKRTRIEPYVDPSEIEFAYTEEKARRTFARIAASDARLGW